MNARIFFHDDVQASNGGGEIYHLCVDGKVHLKHSNSWYDQTGDEANAYSSEWWGEIEPCDGSCCKQMELPPAAVKLVEKFLATDGKERGEIRSQTPTYPNWEDYQAEKDMD